MKHCMVMLISVLLLSNCAFSLNYKAEKVEGGEEHSIVLLTNKTLASCGDNGFKELGQGEVGDQNQFGYVLAGEQSSNTYISNILGFDAGWQHSIAVDGNGYCFCWGSDSLECLGNGDSEGGKYVPDHVLAGEQSDPNNPQTYLQNIVGVAAGRSGTHSLAIEETTGYILAWGNNNNGQLGCNSTEASEPEPKYVHAVTQDPNIPGDEYLSNIIDVSAGEYHSMALDSGGHVYCFGGCRYNCGILGDGDLDGSSSIPVLVNDGLQNTTSGLLENIIAIDSGWDHCMALEAIDSNDASKNGRVWTWGEGGSVNIEQYCDGGRLGDGSTSDRSEPVYVKIGDDPLENITAISAGDSHSIALDSDGNVWAWGDNGFGQLGQGNSVDSLTAIRVKGGDQGGEYLENIVSIGAGYWHNIAIDEDGNVYTWGESINGKLGLGSVSGVVTAPRLVTLPTGPGGIYIDLSLTYENSVAGLDPTDPNGNDVTFSISVTNPGTDDPNYIGDVNDVDLMLFLPEGLDYESVDMGSGLDFTIDFNYDSERKIYTWPITTALNPGATLTKTLTVHATYTAEPGTPLTCTARMDLGYAYDSNDIDVEIADWYETNNGVIYVDAGAGLRYGKGTSWTYPYVRLQDALKRAGRDANSNNEIWVAKGYYYAYENDNFKIPMGVEVYGGFEGIAAETTRSSRDFILNDCRLYGYGCDYVVEVADANSTATPVLDGFIVSAGKKAGVYLYGRDLDIYSCVLTGNGYVNGSNGYGVQATNADPEIIDCIVSHNENEGVYLSGSNAIVTSSYFANNGANGIYVNSSSTLDIINSAVFGNAENGVYAATSNTNTIRNCTITSNTGRAIKANSSNTQVSNCILWSNSDIANTAKTVAERTQFENCSITYSCINDPNDVAGTTTGYDAVTHNTIENPDLIYSDPNCVILFAIDSTSPCKDHGLNTSVQTGELDFYGSDRIYNTTVDMGAFEVNAQSAVSSLDYNSDAIINLIDFAPLKAAWQTSSGGANWNANCDYDSSGTIDANDFELFATDWLWEPYFVYNGNMTGKAHYDYLLRPLPTADTLIPMEMSMMSMSMSLDSVSIDSVAGDDRETSSLESLSTLSTVESTEPEVILIEHVETPRKPAPEPTDLEKAHEIAQSLVWLDDLWYEGQIGDNITDEEWLMFRESIVDDIEALMEE